jgi:hypothetical protein
MSIDDLRARQHQSIMRSEQSKLFAAMAEKAEMKPKNVERIRTAHPEHFHPSVASVPDGWTEFVLVFLNEFESLGEGMMSPGDIRFERTNSGLKAHVWANPEMQWTPKKSWELLKWQRVLYKSSRDACEWCSKLGAQPVQLGDRVTFFLCEEHALSARAKLAAQVQAFEERVKFREEVSCLFQPMSVMTLQVSDHNLEILHKALREIKRIAEERDLVGKILVTKVHESEGQLFLSARCDQADPATQFEVADIVRNAEWKSDQASLAANKESDDDAR